MTTIAYDGNILASDRGSTANGISREVEKMFEVELHEKALKRFRLNLDQRFIVYAACGSAAEVPLILSWMETGEELPILKESDFQKGLIVSKYDRKCYGLTGLLTLERYEQNICASGGGFDMALGAMLSGASALKALDIIKQTSYLSMCGVSYYDFNIGEKKVLRYW